MIEYSIDEIEEIPGSYQIKITYEIRDDKNKLVKKDVVNHAFAKSSAHTIVKYDDKNKPVPKWKEVVELNLKRLEKFYLNQITSNNIPEDLKIKKSKKIKL